MFGDLNKDAGVKALNAHLADNSYIEGFVPSQADAAVFDLEEGKNAKAQKFIDDNKLA